MSYIKSDNKFTEKELRKIDSLYKANHPTPKKILPKPPQSIVEPVKPPERTELPPLSTIGELSAYLQVSRLTLKRYEKAGRIKAIRINSRGDRRYLKEEVMRFLESK